MDNPTTSNPPPESKLHFLDYWRIIRIRKTVIFAVFLLVVLTTTVVTYWLPKYYASTVRIAVDKDTSDIPGLFELRQSSIAFDPYFIQTEFEKIQSRLVLYRVIDDKDLDLNRAWAGKYNVSKLETPETYQFLKKRIDVRQYRNTSLIEIRVLSEDKNEAAAIANKIAQVYRDTRIEKQEKASKSGIRTLLEQKAEQDKKVSLAQTNVALMREKYGISDISSDNPQSNTLEPETVRRMEAARIDALAAWSQMNVMLVRLKAMQRAELRQAMPTAYPDTLLNDLLTRYDQTEQQLTTESRDLAPGHPQIERLRRLLDKINQQIEAKLDGMLVGIQTRVDALKNELDTKEQELARAKATDIENAKKYGEYFLAKRNLEFERQMSQAMAMKITQESVDVKLSKSSIVEVIDPAEPALRPFRPNIPVNIALGIIVGLIVGVGLAFFIEYLDTSVKTIDDVERSLQAPVLGVIPQNVGYLIEEGPESPHAEAYRVLRTNLLFSRKDDRWNTVTVVSGGAGEGKSTTVFNLATVFAQNGQRVLIVDSDLRRPSIHKFLKVSNSLGLTNYLLKQKGLEEVIQTTKLPTLDFLPSGKLPSSSMGILNSTRMKEFIDEVRRRYDYVFFDSPPIMGVSDASILASEVDMTLLVVQYRKYPQLMTNRAKQMVEKVGGHMMGVVLNNINISQDSYYYYYSGYYYDYYYKREEESVPKNEPAGTDATGAQAKLDLKQKY